MFCRWLQKLCDIKGAHGMPRNENGALYARRTPHKFERFLCRRFCDEAMQCNALSLHGLHGTKVDRFRVRYMYLFAEEISGEQRN